ncbi:MAG: NADPH-dependent aldehyde reductase Ahr [Nitrospinales bacterium]
MFKGYSAKKAGGELKPFEYELGKLGPDEVQIKVQHCGICHSDQSMLNNDWGITQYPFVPGHEIVGVIEEIGELVKNRTVGQRVGVGWHAGTCMHCKPCLSGDQNLCANANSTIVGNHGGFADRVRVQQTWAIPLPDQIDIATAGPLFCGGVTVFNPLIQYQVKPTDRVGVIGIGGLGHMALQFLLAWGCEVTAFSSNKSKEAELNRLGVHRIINSRDSGALAQAQGTLDIILSTVNVPLDWNAYMEVLRPKGRLHFLGVTVEPISVNAFPMILGQKSISGSPVGSPSVISEMLDFSVLHEINPVVETFQMSQVNDAMERLKSGNARYRIVLSN